MFYKIILFSILNIVVVNAQNNKMNATRKDLETKSKSELVEIALTMIKEKDKTISIDKTAFKISAFKNSKDVIIKFERIVRFISSKNSRTTFEVTVNLVTNESIPFDNAFFGLLYQPSEYDLNAIGFVKKHFGDFSPEFIHTITETEEEYTIERTNEYSFGSYILSKKTGAIISNLETSYLPAPEPDFPEEDPIIELF